VSAPEPEAPSVATPLGVRRPPVAPVAGEFAAEERRAGATWRGRRDFVVRRVMAAADMVAIAAAAAVAFLVTPVSGPGAQFIWALPTLPAWVALFGVYGLYHRASKRIGPATLEDLPAIFHALVVGTLALWLYYRVVPGHDLVYMQALVFGVLGIAFTSLLRLVAKRAVPGLLGRERVLFLGEAPSLPALVRKIRGHPEYGLEPVGLVSHDSPGPEAGGLPVLGRLDRPSLSELVERHDVERLIVSRAGASDAAMLELLQVCRDLSLKISLLPAHVDAIGPSMEVDDIEGITVLGLNPLTLSRSSRFLKRSMDIVGATVALLLFSPLIALVAVAVKLDRKGSVLFKQERIGRRGQPFRLLKFRSMVPGAERQVEELFELSDDPHWLKLDHDPRITRVGRVLRLTSIDELPQLWNVLKGDMSLVGPRPLIETEDATVSGWARTRLDLAPGITGLWQVLGRTSIPFEEMVKLDCLYVTNWSLWLDVKLLLRTFPVVVRRRGAN
jgi:exopolysaccharide biosynthesis polyprenyl glycosylphosphotransferase